MIVEDKLSTPYVTYTHIPTNTVYVRFPFFKETEYQKTRYYSDDKLLTYEEFIGLIITTGGKDG